MGRVCFGLTRTLVIIVNLIIIALSSLLIYVSFNAFDQDYDIDTLSDGRPKIIHTYVSIICAGLGAIVAVLALLGLLGAVKKSKSVLATYAVIILFLVLILLVAVLITYSLNPKNPAHKEMDRVFVNSTVAVYNFVDSSEMKTRIIDNLQRSFQCCGVNSPDDWSEFSLRKIPKSCCSEPVESALPVFKYCSESDYKTGCWKALSDHFYANLASVRIILYTLTVFGLICTSAAYFMIRTLRRNSDVV